MAAEAFYPQAHSYLKESDQQKKTSDFKTLSLKGKLEKIKNLMERYSP